jgi:hypothetical protein
MAMMNSQGPRVISDAIVKPAKLHQISVVTANALPMKNSSTFVETECVNHLPIKVA